MSENLTDELDLMKISGPPSFSDMPMETVYKIVGKVDPYSRLAVRKVCRKLRNVIDDTDPGFKYVKVDLSRYASRLWLTNIGRGAICYSRNSNDPGCTVRRTSQSKSIEKTQLNAILDDLAVIVKNPKLRLDNFVIVSSHEASKQFVEWIRDIAQSGILLHTKKIKLDIFPLKDVFGVLSHCKPGFLEDIEFYCYDSAGKMDEIINLEQWKRAKSINIEGRVCEDIPIEHFFHFSRITIKLRKLSVSDAIKIRDDLMKSAHFEYAYIKIIEGVDPDVLRAINPNYHPYDALDPFEHGNYTFRISSDKDDLALL
uniref:Feminization of germline protein n=1 Tax=Caenorhabditis elegans TaxID=6239 RepID=G5EDT7_CAEEL|nr:feminization of germline protein [Caenorhabditis elegans]ADE20058.1 feminization of germline protein [Caenorhabditis elegans]ADE20061.1 feminization of germline protein [Caenorhabditis elegans]